MSSFDEAIADLASRQHAVVSAQQALDLGGSRRMLGARVRQGRLVPADIDVFRVAGAPMTWESRVLAAVLSAGPSAVASHTEMLQHCGASMGSGRGRPKSPSLGVAATAVPTSGPTRARTSIAAEPVAATGSLSPTPAVRCSIWPAWSATDGCCRQQSPRGVSS